MTASEPAGELPEQQDLSEQENLGETQDLSETPDVAVVVPARDAGATLHRAVASALSQEVPGRCEIVVAVAPSHDGTAGVADRLATANEEVRVVDNPDATTPAGLNAAIAASRGEVVVRLDAHAELEDGYIARAIETLRDTGAVNVGGRQVPAADEGFGAAVAAAMSSVVGAGGARYRVGGEAGPVETVYLGVFRRSALEAVGGFDEDFVRNQDYELNHRLREAGGTVYFDPELAVRYRPRDTVGGLWRQYFSYGVWRRRTILTHPSSLRLRQLAPPLLILALVATGMLALATGMAWPLLGVAAAELVVVLGGAAAAAPSVSLLPVTALALLVMHLAWGCGLLVGRTRRTRERGERP